ncbi:ATP-binding protein [Nocardia bovistercoris]|uniref:ATP-binding protein n=1 Tax=Nocardia bovistercoris TaxID=2785916 RepID=A0A931N4A9_9NOCA|nr:ATP-binding protein [Nocardia bovistercoris]
MAETKLVRAGKETVLANIDRYGPVDVIAELVWNALDAEATRIETTVAIGATGAPEEIAVMDDGHGISYDDAADMFLIHGESWKSTARFSKNENRPLHGRLGRGRFHTYAIAEQAEWRSVAGTDAARFETVILGKRSHPQQFDFDGPAPTSSPCGTTVTLIVRQIAKVNRVVDSDLNLPLTAKLAPTLLAMPHVTVTYRMQPLDPKDHIKSDTDILLNTDGVLLHGKSYPRLRFVEWSSDMQSKTLYLCDPDGAVVTEYAMAKLPPAPIHWTAYLQWEGFRDPTLMDQADLRVPDLKHGELLSAVHRALVEHLNQRLDEQKGSILGEWKAQGVYPYRGEPASTAERLEREIFDIVAVVASPAIGRDVRQKRFSLRLLQEATRAEPTRTKKILNAVLDLSEEEQSVLAELLERTRLPLIVRTAQTVADRTDFIYGLRQLLYSDETRTEFREVDQLHPMLAAEPWIFGDEWALSLSEGGLKQVVDSLVTRGRNSLYSNTPVNLPSGRKGRVDMVFSRELPESDRTRHLVVELKRPKRVGMEEVSQVVNYAAAITNHPSVTGTPHTWDFWLVTTEIDFGVRAFLGGNTSSPNTHQGENYRLTVVTWADLLDRAERRVRALRSALQLVSDEESSTKYLEQKHAEFIPRK